MERRQLGRLARKWTGAKTRSDTKQALSRRDKRGTAVKLALTLTVLLLCATSAASAKSCLLTAAGKAANAVLSYEDFDQKGTLPSSFRALDRLGCDAAAAEAAEDYMLHHPALTNGERLNLLFHEGQSRAKAGDERAAATLIAAARDLTQSPDDAFDWNTYVEGTWAFLVKDRARLEAAYEKLNREGSEENAINAKALRGLINCFGRPYKVAYGQPGCIGR
jgi:hypothetical protein